MKVLITGGDEKVLNLSTSAVFILPSKTNTCISKHLMCKMKQCIEGWTGNTKLEGF